MKVQTYLTRAKFQRGCMLTGDRDSWCTDAETWNEVRPGTPGTAEYIVRQERDAKTAAIVGRDHTDFAACHKHAKNLVKDNPGIWTAIHVERVIFADA